MARVITSVFVVICVVTVIVADLATKENLSQTNEHTCGVSKVPTAFIIHGKSFLRGSYPWIVTLLDRNYSPARFFCSGTLISSTFVISAAHCIRQKKQAYEISHRQVLAVFGVHDLTQLFGEKKIELSPIRIILHEEWDASATRYDADISLLEFEDGKISFSFYIKPICFWTLAEKPAATEGIVAGWGRSEDSRKLHEEIPRRTKVLIEGNENCFLASKELLALSSNRTFCAGLWNGTGVCHGDSGGGLFIIVGGITYLRGIVSSSVLQNSNCDVYKNAVYTDVLKFVDWITKKTRGAFAIFRPPIRTVSCEIKIADSWFDNEKIKTCEINEAIGTEYYVLGSVIDTNVLSFYLHDVLETDFLPKLIGEKLPYLEEFTVHGTGLSILRSFYFRNLKKLRFLTLYGNKIAKVERDALKDLKSVEELRLQHNRIETLDENLFSTMVNLKKIFLNHNNLKFLMPATFMISDGNLSAVNLHANVCIDKFYNFNTFYRLEADLRRKCMRH